MRLLDYAVLKQSEDGRGELARRALEILASKSDDNASYGTTTSASGFTHLATEEVLPKRA